jgi:hypothetical protein
LTIAKLRENTMAGDYARVLHKLAVLLTDTPGSEVEGSEKKAAAIKILARSTREMKELAARENDWTAVSASFSARTDSEFESLLAENLGEEHFDELVYILWR